MSRVHTGKPLFYTNDKREGKKDPDVRRGFEDLLRGV
jgi:hypothetical protein